MVGEEGGWQTAGQARVVKTSTQQQAAFAGTVREDPPPLVVGRGDNAKAGLSCSCVIPPWGPSGRDRPLL